MNPSNAKTAIALVEGTFHRYDEKGLAATAAWLERSAFTVEDLRAVIDVLVEKGAEHPPKPGQILNVLRELDRIPHGVPGTGDPRAIAKHTEWIREAAQAIGRIRNISFREAVEGIRDEQKDWLEEGTRMDYLDADGAGWHRDRIEACVRLLAGRERVPELEGLQT